MLSFPGNPWGLVINFLGEGCAADKQKASSFKRSIDHRQSSYEVHLSRRKISGALPAV